MEWMVSFLTGLTALIIAVGTVITTFFKTKKQVEDSIPKRVKNQVNIDAEIVSRMDEIKELVKADRVQIYDFHNGGHYANGRSALKTTCTYEVIRAGVKSHFKELESMPLSCMPTFIKTLLDKKEMVVKNLEDIKDKMPSTYNLKHSQDVKSFYDIVLENKDGDPIGFLGIQYITDNNISYNNNERNEILRLKFFIEENLEKLLIRK